MFLFTTSQDALDPRDKDNPVARWVEIGDVEALLTHERDKAFFSSVKTLLQQCYKDL